MTDKQIEMEKYTKDIIKKIEGHDDFRIVSKMKPTFHCLDAEQNSLTLSYPVEDWELNPEKIMHGGLITTAFDNTYGILCHYYAQDKFITTVSIQTSFLKPIPLGDRLLVKVSAKSIGRTIISMVGEAHLASSGVIAATSTSTFMILNKHNGIE